MSIPTADERERLRAMIRAEVERQHAVPVARRTLELMAEAAAEPVDAPPGYRVVDRNGEPRLRAVPESDAVPLTLADLVDGLRERYPALFAPPPELSVAPEPLATPDAPSPGITSRKARPAKTRSPKVEVGTEVREATARFVDTQSALAKSFAATSTDRGRALAASAAGAFANLRTRFRDRPNDDAASATAPTAASRPVDPIVPRETELPPATMPPSSPSAAPLGATATSPQANASTFYRDASVTLRAHGTRIGEQARDGAQRLASHTRERMASLTRARAASVPPLPEALPETGRALGRRSLFAGIGALALVAVGAGFLLGRGGPEPSPSEPVPRTDDASRAAAPAQPKTPPVAATGPESKPAVPEGGAASGIPAGTNEISGPVEVIDTATLRVSGKLVRLFGVEWVRGGQSEELSKYLSGRPVSCQPAPGSTAHLCSVDGRDLSEVVLFNGGGRASSEATPDLAAAEDHARTERLGVWKR